MTHFLCSRSASGLSVIRDVPEGFVAEAPLFVMTSEQVAAENERQATIPKSVTARQVRLWMIQHGVAMSAVDAAISAIADEQTRESVRVEWEYAPYIERSHPMLAPLAAALGMDDAALDAAFREAATL